MYFPFDPVFSFYSWNLCSFFIGSLGFLKLKKPNCLSFVVVLYEFYYIIVAGRKLRRARMCE